jgi:hypothetical protein
LNKLAHLQAANGRGLDQVVDIGGGTLEQSIKAVALDGLINFIGRLSASRRRSTRTRYTRRPPRFASSLRETAATSWR